VVVATLATMLAAGCGGDDSQDAPEIRKGAVLYRDALDNNADKWLVVPGKVFFRDRAYQWNDVPRCCATSLPDAELGVRMPAGVAASVDVQMRGGAALRGVTCREVGGAERDAWYELGIDGRRALVRRMTKDAPPKVLAARDGAVPNGRTVRLTGRCVPDGDQLALSVVLDGREAATATDSDPVSGKPSTVGVFAYRRPDSKGSADLTFDNFEIRTATTAGGS
jgi:hypothetical protein